MGGTDVREPGRAFIGSFTSAGGRGILAADVDPATGALTVTGATDVLPDPSYLALAGPLLYAVSEAEEGAVAAFDVSGGAPRPLGAPVAVRGAGPTHLAVAAGHVLTANYTSGSVTALPVTADGSLDAAAVVALHEGSGPVADRQSAPHAHHVLPAPGGPWAAAVDLGTDSVRIYALHPVTGAPKPHGETPLRPGTGPRHLAFHPAGTHAYVVNELEPTLTVCRWDAATGTLEPLGETSVVPEGSAGPDYPSEVVVAPDGRFLWVAVRGADTIAVLALDPGGEKAEFRAAVPCGGRWPRDLALGPTGRRLYAANERSGDVTWFDVDPESGIPHRAGSVDAPAASCVVFSGNGRHG
ncbi:lactonase family protein [Streptomyces sp. Je 1-79]|uniref:lactonase family protein n=1 Tax=Streptomyces sp. Je 1-79 TaxID=2943847 RepID=UPI0021A5899B|nr:lactonase family protein [Streptomyces sp. Je 1-79]MCT4353817.1 lactonase family protein [Streptomyces sp. Je 1-79]